MQPNLKLGLGALLVCAVTSIVGPIESSAAAPPACTLNWVGHGTTGSWSDANNWADASTSVARAPTSTDVVCIGAGFTTTEPTITSSLTVANVQASSPIGIQQFVTLSLTDTADASMFNGIDSAGGSIDSAGTVTIAGTANWGADVNGNGGKLTGSGGISDFTGTVNFTASAEVGAGHKLVTDATGSWTGRQINFDAGASWTNNGTFKMSPASGSSIYWSSGSGGELYNSSTGKLLDNVAPASGATTAQVNVSMPLRNDGTVQSTVAGSRLAFSVASGVSHGNFGGSGPGTVFLSDAFKVDNGATFDHLEIQNGALLTVAGADISGGSVTLDIPYGYCCVSSRLGGKGKVTVHGTLTSPGGTLDGNGTVDVAPDGTLLVPYALYVNSGMNLITEGSASFDRPAANGQPEGGGSATFYGTASWTNTGSILLGIGTTVGDSLGCQSYAPCARVPGYGVFANQGAITTVTQSGPSTVNVQMPMVNSGSFVGDTINPNKVVIDGGIVYLTTGADVLYSVDSGTMTDVTLNHTQLAGGSVIHTSALRTAVSLAGGSSDVYDSDVGALNPSCTCGGGTLGGDGTVRLFGTDSLDGTMQGGGTTILMPGATLTVNSASALADSRLLETYGNTTIPTTNSVAMTGHSAWINAGTLTIDSGQISGQNGLTSATSGSAEPVLYNTGTIAEVNAGTGWIGTLFNDGTISIHRGELYFDALTETSDAVVDIGAGSTTAQSGYGVLNLGPRSYTYGQDLWGLAGKLQVALDPGYAPANGDKYDVVTGAPTDGSTYVVPTSTFDSFSAVGAPPGTTFTYATTTGTQPAVLASPLELTAHVGAAAAVAAPAPPPVFSPAAVSPVVSSPAATSGGSARAATVATVRDRRIRAILVHLHARRHHRSHGGRHRRASARRAGARRVRTGARGSR